MKKVALLVTVLFIPLLLTGCGKKQTLTCTQNIMGIADMEISLYYSGGKPTGGQYKYTITYDYGAMGATDEEIEEAKKESMCDSYTKDSDESDDEIVKAFGKCTEKWDGSKITLTINLEKKLGDIDGYKTIDDAKASLEKDGAKCEIK